MPHACGVRCLIWQQRPVDNRRLAVWVSHSTATQRCPGLVARPCRRSLPERTGRHSPHGRQSLPATDAKVVTGLVAASLRTSHAARVRGHALQRGRHTRGATRTTRLTKMEDEAMAVNAGVACMGCDSRRWAVLGRSPRETYSEGRDVKTTGGAHARRGVLVSAGGYA